MLFKALEDKYIDEFLIAGSKNPVPGQYIEFLKSYNGANLCSVKLKTKKAGLSFAENLLSIYGIPMTPPFNRPDDMEEPFDVRTENLARHKKLPKSWMKCGAYDRISDFARIDIFIDTENGLVYSCPKNEAGIVGEWNDLDECLCELFDELSAAPLEYQL